MDSKRNIVTLKLNRMNKEKQHLIELLNKIDNTKKELKQLNKEYKAAFADICKSWVEQTKSQYPTHNTHYPSGISLIALIITIVVLIILASITICQSSSISCYFLTCFML